MKKRSFSALMSLVLCLCMLASMAVVSAGAAEIKDLDDDHWAKESAERWTQAGIMDLDEDGNFNPTTELTRADFAVLLCKLMGYTEKSDAETFVDLPEDAEKADALLKLNAAGVMKGIGDNKADPDGLLTREVVAVMVFRALKLQADPENTLPFDDSHEVSSWAEAELAAMTNFNMLDGVGNNTLAPQQNIANQDMAALLDKMVAAYVTEDGATVDISKSANPNGVVIIKADNVKIADAGESTAVVVTEDAPKDATVTVTGTASNITVAAEGATVAVAKNAEVNSVTVEAPKAAVEVSGKVSDVSVAKTAEDASVTVEKGAEVTTVAVEAPKTAVEVAGKVSDVAVTADAESTSVNVIKGAEVASVSVEAPKTSVEVSGKVTDVAVAEGADNATVTAKSGSKVENVTTSAEDVTVNGAKNTIQNVTADAGSADVKASGATVSNTGAEDVKVDNKPVDAGSSAESTQTGANTSTPDTSTSTGNSGSSGSSGTTTPSTPGGSISDITYPSAPTYTVTVSTATNGTVTVDKSSATEGETVTLTITPAAGYQLGTITVTNASGSAVTMSGNTFTMPASNVTVTVTFKAEAATLTIKKADETGLGDKPVAELGETLVVSQNGTDITVTGTANYITGWTEFSTDTALQKGHYLALNIKPTEACKVTLTGSGASKVIDSWPLAGDNLVVRLDDIATKKITVAVDGGATYTINVTNVTLSHFGAEVAITEENLSSMISGFSAAFYNKFSDKDVVTVAFDGNGIMSVTSAANSTVDVNQDTLYVAIPCDLTTGDVTVGGQSLTTSPVSVSIGKNAQLKMPMYVLTGENLLIGLPAIATESATAEGLAITVGDETTHIKIAATNAIESVTFKLGTDSYFTATVDGVALNDTATLAENAQVVCTLKDAWPENPEWGKRELWIKPTGNSLSLSSGTVYLTKKIDGGVLSYGFTKADGSDGELLLYSKVVGSDEITFDYTIATSDRYGPFHFVIKYAPKSNVATPSVEE